MGSSEHPVSNSVFCCLPPCVKSQWLYTTHNLSNDLMFNVGCFSVLCIAIVVMLTVGRGTEKSLFRLCSDIIGSEALAGGARV